MIAPIIVDKTWTQEKAVTLCTLIEALAPKHGCHVALTGGCLYKAFTRPRKDCDVLFYRIRQVKQIDREGLFKDLENIGMQKKSGFGWCVKFEWRGLNIDAFFPESDVEGEAYGELEEKPEQTNLSSPPSGK